MLSTMEDYYATEFICLFIYLFCLIMLTCYNLIPSDLPLKVDSIN